MITNLRANYEVSKVMKIALHCLRLIRDRTQSGLDVNDSPFKPYSTYTFKMLASTGIKRAFSRLKSQGLLDIRIIGGVKYAIIKGGYFNYKKAYVESGGNAFNSKPDLTFTGSMLRDMNVIETTKDSFRIGFTNIEMSKRALKNIDKGRDFLGLSPKNLQDPTLLALLSEGLQLELI